MEDPSEADRLLQLQLRARIVEEPDPPIDFNVFDEDDKRRQTELKGYRFITEEESQRIHDDIRRRYEERPRF